MLCLPTHAALSIISSEETVITAESDLDNSGTLVAAVNFTSTSQASAPTVNEITFTNQTDLTGVSTNLSSLTNDYATSNYSTSGDVERVGAFDGVFDGRIVNSVNQGGGRRSI